ncbi:lipase 1 [Culex quinquefasciatus]|uniref:lipase 1 n=1 Tax=Culex quinquefasciatus TaxID=7176 RepID=UPI0018E3DE11|nr:lipase 1 [Culex quinquefasciatus]
MYNTTWWLIVPLIFAVVGIHSSQRDDDGAELLVPELIVKYGYKVEDHNVITEDGYVLKVFQMPPRQRSCVKKKPVLLVHGLLSSSADYVFAGPNSSLAYQLSDNGYDVWLANMRGSRYSREHLRLPVQSKEYWDFSWHEMGVYDLPAIIDLVLNATNFKKLLYIGHSQGVTEFFVMANIRPEYNNKIALMTGLSPAVAQTRFRSPILSFACNYAHAIKKTLEFYKIYEFLPQSKLYRSFCQTKGLYDLCLQLYGLIFGPHPEETDRTLLLRYLANFPQGSSFNQLLHYAQVAASGGRFQWFDYGRKGNLEKYRSSEPPAYNLTAATAPVLIFYGLNDWMVHPKDAQKFSTMLPNLIAAVPVANRKFNHMDFVLATNVRKVLYEKVLLMLDKYN